jgi:hypothetical protein
VVALGGAGVPKRTDELLDVVRPYANNYFLVFDNEGTINKPVEAHFTVEELCDVVEAHIRAKDSWPSFCLDRTEVQARVLSQASRSDGKAVLSVIHDVAEDQTARFDKEDVAIDLAAHAHAHPQHPNGGNRPLFGLLDEIVMAAESDRQPPSPSTTAGTE